MNLKICYWSKSEISFKIVKSTQENRNRGDLATASEYEEFFLVLRGNQTTHLPCLWRLTGYETFNGCFALKDKRTQQLNVAVPICIVTLQL